MCAFDKSKKEEIFTKAVRAGKRTYFFDVKVTSNGDKYLTITERKRKVNQRTGEFFTKSTRFSFIKKISTNLHKDCRQL